MNVIYALIGGLYGAVIFLFILVLKYRSDVNFFKDMCKINNDYIKECKEGWVRTIKLCKDLLEERNKYF